MHRMFLGSRGLSVALRAAACLGGFVMTNQQMDFHKALHLWLREHCGFGIERPICCYFNDVEKDTLSCRPYIACPNATHDFVAAQKGRRGAPKDEH